MIFKTIQFLFYHCLKDAVYSGNLKLSFFYLYAHNKLDPTK
jgi:hypothetical protein